MKKIILPISCLDPNNETSLQVAIMKKFWGKL
jgi:hypothetical protein